MSQVSNEYRQRQSETVSMKTAYAYDLNIVDFKSKPPDYSCACSPFIYNPAGHVISGDQNIINNIFLRDVFAKSINWKHIFKIPDNEKNVRT